MAAPGSTLIGVTLVGFAGMMAYGALRNIPVFGRNGILTQAITTGKIPTLPARTSGIQGHATQGFADPSITISKNIALANVAAVDPALATQMQNEFGKLDKSSSPTDVNFAYSLVQIASTHAGIASGSIAALNAWIADVTGQAATTH